MPNTARVLKFPCKAERPILTVGGAHSLAERYLATGSENRTREQVVEFLREPDAILAICQKLNELRESAPVIVAEEAKGLYSAVGESTRVVGIFDERHYFLGELALLAAGSLRLLGKRDDAEFWLDRAEAGFRHTINPTPGLARVSSERVAIQYDMGRYDRVLESLPSLIHSFETLGMRREALKGRLTMGMTLKVATRLTEARQVLEELTDDPTVRDEPAVYGFALVNLAELRSSQGLFDEAIGLCSQALPLLRASEKPFMIAHMKGVIGECLRQQGKLESAVEAYREAIQDYDALKMATWVAYVRVIVAETLIALDRYREAEWELLAALPTIEEQKMVPEGFAAVALLKESVRRRKTDPNALRELREHLQASK